MVENYIHSDLTGDIIKCFYTVYNKLGYGFLEKVYEKSLRIELEAAGFKVECQKPIDVYYNEELVGEYFADIIVEDSVIIELKASRELQESHSVQLINYLKATDIEVGLLFNFGEIPKVKRRIFTNTRKQHIQIK